MINHQKEALLDAIGTIVGYELCECLTSKQLENVTNSLNNFVIKAIKKYYKGQLEHGGDICDRNLQHEILQETIDLFWYNEASKWKQQANKKAQVSKT